MNLLRLHIQNIVVQLKKNNFKCVFQNDILKGAKEIFSINNQKIIIIQKYL